MKYIVLALSLASATLGFSQTENSNASKKDTLPTDPDWKLTAISGLLANQANFTNWQAGGINSTSINAFADLSADYAKGKWSWENTLKLGYGTQFQDQTDWRKTDDIIDLSTIVGYSLDTSNIWKAAGTANFRTQFTDGFEFPTDSTSVKRSSLFAPAYVTIGLGLSYKPKSYVSFLFTPLTAKITIVNDQTLADAGIYGNEGAEFDGLGNVVLAGKNVRTEFGASLNVKFKKELVKNITYSSTLNLFSNYKENPQNVDVIFNNLITFKVNKAINFSFILDMIYDDDILITELNEDGTVAGVGPRLQVKQLFGFGLTYTIRNYKQK